MKQKSLLQSDTYLTPKKVKTLSAQTAHQPGDNPQIITEHDWTNKVLNFDHLNNDRRTFPRVQCYGPVVFYNKQGKIVAHGDMRDLNEKSGGFEIETQNLKVDDILYLEILNIRYFVLTQVKVQLKRIQLSGDMIKVGVEFIDATPAFQSKLERFLRSKRNEMNGFKDVEII